jgi:protein-L-isoaspartate O-methyltransferase
VRHIDVDPKLLLKVMEEIDRQIFVGEPPEVRQTYDRLLAAGHPTGHARHLIALVYALEMIRALRSGGVDVDRYSQVLRELPRVPEVPREP